MKYFYYPGCSLEGTAQEYNLSTETFMAAVGAELIEIQDWVCCGASAAAPTSHLLSLALPAINLAIAERANAENQNGNLDILVPCSACYINLKRVEEVTRKDTALLNKINLVLEVEGHQLQGNIHVRHLLDVIVRDMGMETFRERLKKPLDGISVAPYYGCQCLRPYRVFDDPEDPRSMEPILKAVGASVHPWNKGGQCCGASHTTTKPEVGLELVAAILKEAKGADAIVTVCPMCQMNLEAYQKKISRKYHEDIDITILYLPQLLCLAFGLSENKIGLDLNLSVTDQFREKIGLKQRKSSE